MAYGSLVPRQGRSRFWLNQARRSSSTRRSLNRRAAEKAGAAAGSLSRSPGHGNRRTVDLEAGGCSAARLLREDDRPPSAGRRASFGSSRPTRSKGTCASRSPRWRLTSRATRGLATAGAWRIAGRREGDASLGDHAVSRGLRWLGARDGGSRAAPVRPQAGGERERDDRENQEDPFDGGGCARGMHLPADAGRQCRPLRLS